MPAFKRVLLKLSGEALMGDQSFGLSAGTVASVARQVKEVHELGTELALVIGAGNIFRGLAGSEQGMERVTADHMGMLATVINSLAMQDALEKLDVATRVLSAIEMRAIAEPYIRRRAVRHLERKRVVIFGAGTGNPYFTTDTAAALRANEIQAEAFLKATQVDGVYSADPHRNPDAELIEELTYTEAMEKKLRVMDSTAFSLCMDNNMPIHVFNLHREGNIKRVVQGEKVGSVVR